MNKKLLVLFFQLLWVPMAFAQTDSLQMILDSLENTLTYQRGEVELQDGIGKLKIPEGFKYLDPEQSAMVLTEWWGNPKSEDLSLGMIMKEDMGVLSDSCWIFNVEYDEIGYVKDDDADDIDYEDLLKDLQEGAKEANEERVKAGFDRVEIVGWASSPYYDKERNTLHWAKEIKFGEANHNTLNYNVRVLGRKGVLVLNAIASMNEYTKVKKSIPEVLNMVEFAEGHKYSEFNPEVDKVAAYTIGGLVAGKILAKKGILVLLAKFWKVIVIAVGGFFAAIAKHFKGKKE